MQPSARPDADQIEITERKSTMTESQAYRALSNYINNNLGLSKKSMDTIIHKMIEDSIQKAMKGDIERIIKRETKDAFALYFSKRSSSSAQEQMRIYIAEQIAEQIKKQLISRLYISTTIEPLADV